jgi:hypothetical protein
MSMVRTLPIRLGGQVKQAVYGNDTLVPSGYAMVVHTTQWSPQYPSRAARPPRCVADACRTARCKSCES